MRRFFVVFSLLLISVCCFAQQNIPEKIIGAIPDRNSPLKYQIQVGAFILEKNVQDALQRLSKNALIPVSEKYLDFTRVMIKGIPANQVLNFLAIIKQAGFNEVIVRESTPAAIYGRDEIVILETAPVTISEKWEINSPDSDYFSFEFNHDSNYIAVENDENRSIRFGEYSIPETDTIDMEKLGIIRIENESDMEVSFSFTSVEEPEKEVRLTAAKAEAIPESPELDLLCRTWRVINCTDEKYIDSILLISNAGTYFYTMPDGTSNSLSSWRWYDDKMEEFEYSHHNWEHYGRAKILNLTVDCLEMFDPGYFRDIYGYSRGSCEDFWELVPVNN